MKQQTKNTVQTTTPAEMLQVSKIIKQYNIYTVETLLDITAEYFGEHCKEHVQQFILGQIGANLYPDILFAGTTFLEMLNTMHHTTTPVTKFHAIVDALNKLGYNEPQQLGLIDMLLRYIDPRYTIFDDWEQQKLCYDMMKNYYTNKTHTDKNKLRQTLERHIATELEQLPETLKQLSPDARIKAQIKLLPILLGEEKPLQQALIEW